MWFKTVTCELETYNDYVLRLCVCPEVWLLQRKNMSAHQPIHQEELSDGLQPKAPQRCALQLDQVMAHTSSLGAM